MPFLVQAASQLLRNLTTVVVNMSAVGLRLGVGELVSIGGIHKCFSSLHDELRDVEVSVSTTAYNKAMTAILQYTYNSGNDRIVSSMKCP